MPPPDKIADLLRSLWERNRPLMMERLATLDEAVASTQAGRLSPAEHEQAESIAHKLAGSLGMFGLHEGTNIARRLEALLTSTDQPDPETFAVLVENLRASMSLGAHDHRD